jgi:Bacterial archaeo-eukaryotic release factor family 7
MQTTVIPPQARLSRDELLLLIAQPTSPWVSLFLPVERAEPARHHTPIRLENLLRQAEQRLIAAGLEAHAAHAHLAPAYQLLHDRAFWAHQAAGLAVFAAAALFRVYRLPLAVEELVVVDARAHITPLLPLLHADGQFYLLTLGLGGVRLFAGTQDGLRAVALDDVPTSLDDALKYDEFAKQTQFHAGVPGRGGERGAIFHGQGARDGTVVKEEILRYFQQVEHGVRRALHDARAPLLLAGVAYLPPIYRVVNTYPQLIEDEIVINPADLRPEELHARAWALVAPRFDRARAAAVARYRGLRGMHSALATSYVRSIIPASYDGRVETLVLATGQQQWGSFDPGSGVLEVHDQAGWRDTELFNLAAVQTIQHGGTVYVVTPAQMPEAAPIAAILRY